MTDDTQKGSPHRHEGHGSAPSHKAAAHGPAEGHEHHHDHHAHMMEYRRRFFVALALTVPVVLLAEMIQHWLGVREALRFPGDQFLVMALSTVIFFYGGWPFLRGLVDEVRERNPGMMTLVGVAITVAFVYSVAVMLGFPGEPIFWELATLITIFLLGHWIEMRSVLGASRALEELVRLMPSQAHRVAEDGSVEDVPISELHTGDRILIRPGEKVPADGVVIEGKSSLNEAMLTGESVPVFKEAGARVIGGSVNGEGALTVEVQKTGKESFLSQVIELVRQAQQSKSRTQDLANRAAKYLTFVALGGGALTLVVWAALAQSPLDFAVERAVTVMVIACPHALGLAVPLVVSVSSSLAAGNGLLIRNRTAFEQARRIDAVIFDKTGTLTKGEFGVTDVLLLDESFDEDEMVALAASLESQSEHPIARGIAESFKPHQKVTDFSAITGKGVRGEVGGRQVMVVSPGYLRQEGIMTDDERVGRLSGEGKTVVFVLVDGKLVGAIAVADIIREESRAAIAALHEMGIKTMMLTGDNEKVARWVADEIGLDEYFAEVLPEEKAEKVKEIQARGLVVAMTGDGVNDAPALAQADVGIAVGAGTDVAIETADIVLVRSNPEDVVAIVGLARSTYSKMVQNLAWATGYNVVAIPLAAGVAVPWGLVLVPAVGAVLMSASTVIVAINSRMLRFERSEMGREKEEPPKLRAATAAGE